MNKQFPEIKEELLRKLEEYFDLEISTNKTYKDLSALHKIQGRLEVIEHIRDGWDSFFET